MLFLSSYSVRYTSVCPCSYLPIFVLTILVLPANLLKDLVEILERLVPELCSSDCLHNLKNVPNNYCPKCFFPQILIILNEPNSPINAFAKSRDNIAGTWSDYLVHGGHVGAPLVAALDPDAGRPTISPGVQAAHTPKHLAENSFEKVKPEMEPK